MKTTFVEGYKNVKNEKRAERAASVAVKRVVKAERAVNFYYQFWILGLLAHAQKPQIQMRKNVWSNFQLQF